MSAINRRVDRSQPPHAEQLHRLRFPEFVRHRLSCGVTMIAARLARVPLATLELALPAGAHHDPKHRGGLATLTAGMLDEGTRRRDVHTLAANVERTGSYLTTSANWDAAFVQTGGLAAHWRDGLHTLAEVALEPTFPGSELERLQRQREAELLARRDQPGALAEDAFARLVYAGTPYDHTLSGDLEASRSTSREDVEDFYRGHLAARGAAFVAAGDFDPQDLLAAAELVFADWPAASFTPPPLVHTLPMAGCRVSLVNRPQAAQTELRIGHAGVSRLDPDRSTLRVLNSLLGGKFTSRINLNLRERHGYTYGASSRFVERLGPGPFVISCAVATEHAGAATREVLGELRRLQEDLVGEDELADARNYLLGVFPYGLQTADDLVDKLEDLAVYDLPDDDFENHLHRMREVRPADIRAAAGTHLHPDAIAVVAVGPASELVPQLADLGMIETSG